MDRTSRAAAPSAWARRSRGSPWPPARAQAGKLAKDAVKYVDKGDIPGKDCDDCLQYIAPASTKAPATCRIVDGPISPHGHCVAFTPRPKSQA